MLDYDKHQRHLITVFSVIPLLLSCAALINWIVRATTSVAGLRLLASYAPGTMLSLFIISVLVMLRGYYKNLRWNLIDYLLLGMIINYCSSIMFSVFWTSQLSPEELFLTIEHSPLRNLLAPMAPLTATFLIFTCISYMILYNPFMQEVTKRRFSGYFSFLVFGGSLLVLISRISHTRLIPAMGVVPMSTITASSLLCLSMGLLESVDLGLLRVLHYVSGNSRDKTRPINQINAIIFLFIVLATIVTMVMLLQTEKKNIKQSLRENLLLNLDARRNAMNQWIKNHHELADEVINDPALAKGLLDIYQGKIHSENAQHAQYWVQITQKQHENIRIAIYDAQSGRQKSFGEEIYFSPRDLQQIKDNLKNSKDVWVQSYYSPSLNNRGYHETEYLRFWASLAGEADNLLFLVELQPDKYFRKPLSQILGNGHISHNHVFIYDSGILSFISEPDNLRQDEICYRIRHLLNEELNSGNWDFDKPYFSQNYSNKASEVYFAAVKIDHVPWFMVQSVDSIYYGRDLARWGWIITGICTFLFLGLSYFMHHSTRRKTSQDDQTVLQEWLNTFNAVPSAIWLMDAGGKIQRSNSAIEQLFGISENEVIGKHHLEIIPNLRIGLDSELLQKGMEMHSEFGHKNRWYDSSIAPIMNSDGTPHSFVQIISDITEKKENIHRLEASEIRFRAIFDQSPIGISIISADMLYLSTNNSFIQILGYGAQEILGIKLSDTAHPDYSTQLETGIKNLLRGKTKYYRQELRFIRKDGSEIWGLLICILISDMNLEGDFVLAMVENIQDRVQAMQELYRTKEKAIMSEKLKSSFMQNISHEFRTPLNGILGFSQILKAGQPTPEEVKEYADSIYLSGKRMHQLVENVMSFAKVDSGQENLQNNPFSLKQMLNKIYDLYKSRALLKNLDLVCELAPKYEESILISDESKIIQLLAKLMDNALGFTERGSVQCHAHLEKNDLILQVIDTGIGIPKAKQSKIFDSFYQADMSCTRTHDGAGLGLSICKGLANILKGDISVSSQLEVGTTFTVRIPVKVQK